VVDAGSLTDIVPIVKSKRYQGFQLNLQEILNMFLKVSFGQFAPVYARYRAIRLFAKSK
jgi:hypothetical protein